MGIKGRGRSGRSRDSNPACLCCSSAHLVQCEPDEASSFTNPNVGPGTYASLRLKLDAWSSAVQRGQKCSSPTRRLPSRSWGPIRPRVCSWFRAPIRHECQTAQLKSRQLMSVRIWLAVLKSCCYPPPLELFRETDQESDVSPLFFVLFVWFVGGSSWVQCTAWLSLFCFFPDT